MKNQNNNKIRTIITILLVFVFIMALYSILYTNNNQGDKLTPTEIVQMIKDGEVSDVYAYNATLKIRKAGSEIKEDDFPSKSDGYCEYTSVTLQVIVDAIYEYNGNDANLVKISFENPPVRTSFFESLMPWLSIILLGLFAFMIMKSFTKSNQGAMSFGKSRARTGENVKVKFSDVAGADEEKTELEEVVEFLKNPKKFTDLGARIPKGILLVGQPGTGKTLLAKAVAGESNVPFLSISGSDFVEMFVGVGASRVRDLFEQAKKSKPCIIFIDEIDAVGRQRGTGLGGGNDEREQTLNQLLVEMDGFEANEGIIVLAATNRSDILDPALMRPGRFDRQVYVHVPDVKGRESIIKIHARNKPLDRGIDYNTLARITSGFTGADIENMLNEAAILAARANRPKIIMEDLTEGINKVIMGPQKKSRLVTEKDKKITAYHESGHAILGKLLENCDEVQEVSIIPRGMAAGYTMSRPDEDQGHMTMKKLHDTIAMMMGGRLAEEIIFKDISTGAQNDIKRATELARRMVTEWGMSEKLGFMSFEGSDELFLGRDYQSRTTYSEKTAGDIDEEIRNILNYNYERSKNLLMKNSTLLDRMSDLLILKETIYKEEVDMIMEGKTVDNIVKHLDKKEEERKQKEVISRQEVEIIKKVTEYENKIKTAEMLVKTGVITIQELEQIKKVHLGYVKQLNEFRELNNISIDSSKPIRNVEVMKTAEPEINTLPTEVMEDSRATIEETSEVKKDNIPTENSTENSTITKKATKKAVSTKKTADKNGASKNESKIISKTSAPKKKSSTKNIDLKSSNKKESNDNILDDKIENSNDDK